LDAELLAIAQSFAYDNQLFMDEFSSAWTKMMIADRFDGPVGNLCVKDNPPPPENTPNNPGPGSNKKAEKKEYSSKSDDDSDDDSTASVLLLVFLVIGWLVAITMCGIFIVYPRCSMQKSETTRSFSKPKTGSGKEESELVAKAIGGSVI